MESEISSSEVLSVRLPLAELSVEIGVIKVSVSSSLTERTSDDDISCQNAKF